MGSEWHPIFHTTEPRPGLRLMQSKLDYGPYGQIELRRVSGGEMVRYKVTLGSDVIGWSMTLQEACERLYNAWIEKAAADRQGPPNGKI